MGAWYRIRQAWDHLSAEPLAASAQSEIQTVLTPGEWALFQHFSDSDQCHSYAVYQTLKTAGHTHPSLLKAALLHDIGKSRMPLSLANRTAIVVASRLWPGRAERWGEGSAETWQRPFVVKRMHPAWGAEMAAVAGCDPLTLNLIARHQDPLPDPLQTEEDELLRWLQWADDLN